MKIEHELTSADLVNCSAMSVAASAPASNRTMALATAAYGIGGAFLIWHLFSLSMWAFIALLAYGVGIVWMIVLVLKQAASKLTSRTRSESSMKREYLVSDKGLEIRMEDLTQTIPAQGIVRLESRERGTLVHLSRSTPMFLPFGSAFHSDFVEALQKVIENKK
jgi:hypothetical protein